MSVAYEPRTFVNEGVYPSMGDDSDHVPDQRYSDHDIAEQLSQYTADASMLPDEREVLSDAPELLSADQDVLGDRKDLLSVREVLNTPDVLASDRDVPSNDAQEGANEQAQVELEDDPKPMGEDQGMRPEDAAAVQEAAQLDMDTTGFESPNQVTLPGPPLSDHLSGSKDPSPSVDSPPSTTSKSFQPPKPERHPVKGAGGKFHCPFDDCKEEVRSFGRKCEWNKHMDKHERPYRCEVPGCENLPGFTYSGGLLRHEREVHGKHGGPKKTVNCPHPTCKRHSGKGFSRQENLNEHLRRVHTNVDIEPIPATAVPTASAAPESTSSPAADDESVKSGMKRKRRGSNDDELAEMREELKRVREENEKLKLDLNQQSQHTLSLMAQVAELEDTLRHSLGQHSLPAPTAQMI